MSSPVETEAPARTISGSNPRTPLLAARALRAGAVVAIPTDTVYGLAAHPDRPEAVRRLFALKGRPAEKAIPLLLDDSNQVTRIAYAISPIEAALMREFWPGSLTLVLSARPGLLPELTSVSEDGTTTVAVRVPDHRLAREIIAAAGGALAVTSANRSGDPPAVCPESIQERLTHGPSLIVDGGPASIGVPSTLVQVLGTQLKHSSGRGDHGSGYQNGAIQLFDHAVRATLRQRTGMICQ